MSAPSCHLLLIEDDDNDAILLERAARNANTEVTLTRCRNLTEAKALLNGEGEGSNRSGSALPQVIICDLRLGIESGFDFLRWLKAHETLRALPIVIMSGSKVPQTIRDAYLLGANAVITKPTQFDRMVRSIDTLAAFWCGIAETPGESCEALTR